VCVCVCVCRAHVLLLRFINVKVELDHGTHCCMSPDGKAFILTQENNQTVNIYKLAKKEDGKVLGQLSLEFPPVWVQNKPKIVSACAAYYICSRSYVLCCSGIVYDVITTFIV